MKSQRRRRKRWIGNWKLLPTQTHRTIVVGHLFRHSFSTQAMWDAYAAKLFYQSADTFTEKKHYILKLNSRRMRGDDNIYTWDCVASAGAYGLGRQQYAPCAGLMPFALTALPSLVFGGELILNYDFFVASIADQMRASDHEWIEIYIFRKHDRCGVWWCAHAFLLCAANANRERKTSQIKQTNVNSLSTGYIRCGM